MRKLACVYVSTTLALLLLASVATSQTTGTVRGTAETGGTPLPGVTVEAKSPNLLGSRTVVTDAEGRFTLTALPPGTYTITATLPDFAPKTETIQLGLSQVATMKLEMVAKTTAEVTVTGEAAPVETSRRPSGATSTRRCSRRFRRAATTRRSRS
jgi:hypothetical protein